ncbi:predicted protein [Lichtheimia corymbifera JMRC:FSU:9682]|uniref:Uncharacterized protein n=1 Tax=Lichtheimia corymbifera JMRC:FSU:9682 TaxID=1263082 RepID=A0A068RSD7_9FUNG|nr:predicted protein [Lichtheimia corymbifera JMRC:FSU:9682]
MLRRYGSRDSKHVNENVEQIGQHKKDTLSTTNASSQLLRPKDANQKRRDKDQGAKDGKDNVSTTTTQKTKIRSSHQESPLRVLQQPKTRPPLGSVTPAKRPLKDVQQQLQQSTPKRIETSPSRRAIPAAEEVEESLDDDDLVALPEVELDLSLFDDDDQSTTEQSLDTTKNIVQSREASPQLLSVDDVEYAGTKEQELVDEPELAVDVSGFESTLPNIGAYDIKTLPELDLELQDDDTPEIITGNTSTLDDDEEGDDEVFLLVVPSHDIATQESSKDDQELDIPFSNHLFNIEQFEDVEA